MTKETQKKIANLMDAAETEDTRKRESHHRHRRKSPESEEGDGTERRHDSMTHFKKKLRHTTKQASRRLAQAAMRQQHKNTCILTRSSPT
jgi:translation initiation factor 2B subunit (eIF-2B alpha/beta/delta family)